ncbi:MAG: hypothetical protein IJD30_05845, partial [Clostridia bacterium]|nr:hypothetical protein [Clostridia bacterium]
SNLSALIVAEAAIVVPNEQYVWNFTDTGKTLDDSYDEELEYEDIYGAKLYDITLTVKGGAKKASVKENGTTVAYTGAYIQGIEGVAVKYTTSKDIVFIKTTKNWSTGTSAPGTDLNKNKIAYAWGAAESSEYIKQDDLLLVTWTIFAADGTDITDMTLTAHDDAKPSTKFAQVWDGTDKDGAENVFAPSSTIVGYPAEQKVSYTAVSTLGAAAQEVLAAKFPGKAYYVKGDVIDFTAPATAKYLYATDGTNEAKTTASIQAHLNIGEGVSAKIIPVLVTADAEGPAITFSVVD